MSLVDFVLARFAEDREQAALLLRRAQEHELHCKEPRLLGREIPGWHDWPKVQAVAERVLDECESKRRLVDWSAPVSGSERVPTDRPGVYDVRPVRHVNEDGEDVLRYLAMPYADHPDYLEEWRP